GSGEVTGPDPFAPGGFFVAAALAAARMVYRELFFQSGGGLLPSLRIQDPALQQPGQGADAESVLGRIAGGKLVGMAPIAHHQVFPDQPHRMLVGDAQPELEILAGRELGIESPRLVEKGARQYHRGGRDHAMPEGRFEYIPVPLHVMAGRIHAHTVADPDFLRLAYG